MIARGSSESMAQMPIQGPFPAHACPACPLFSSLLLVPEVSQESPYYLVPDLNQPHKTQILGFFLFLTPS